ncbi:MAG: CCA tRNA nucleotidyltransferase [Clostridium sp.]|uniref:CCA tRNA nucleotidyltransferase n=1 Tax=Clostridium sp. TaxID=1506 RepID=UPI003F2A7CDB
MQIKLPTNVKFIINTLIKNGYEAYVVGGCVRDCILKRKPKDWDICTNALPDIIISIFDKTIPTGLKHGTVTVMIDNEGYEVTTFRIDGKYKDGRHPDGVEFTNDLIMDLSRRDFTINAMAYNDSVGLIDPFCGVEDLNNKHIKTVGHAYDRFSEDALRMLRAIRFSAQLWFEIDNEIIQAIKHLNSNLSMISKERIRDEFEKILMSNSSKINDLVELGIMRYIIPELEECVGVNQDNPYHCFDVYKHLLFSTEYVDYVLHLKLTMLLHDICKPQCKTIDANGVGHFYNHAKLSSEKATSILRELKYDNNTINKVNTLIKYHDREIAETRKSIRKLLNLIGEDMFRDLLRVKFADIMGQNPSMFQDRADKLVVIKNILDEIIESKECFTIKDLNINGNDLIEMGVKKGREVGLLLNFCLNHVLDNPDKNNKEDLISIVKRNLKNI